MGTGFSGQYLKKNSRGLQQLKLRLMIKLLPAIQRWRNFRRKLAKPKKMAITLPCQITDNLEGAAEHFQKHGWVFLENIIEPSFHQLLLKNWPKKYYFNPPRKMTKSYNTGFNWTFHQETLPENIEKNPVLLAFFNYLRSPEMAGRINKFTNRNKDFSFYSFILNSTYTGSQVAPHKDGIAEDHRLTDIINLVFFVNGKGGKKSGGLMIAKDNELNDVIFEPQNLFNSCLIYDIKADFYHGFPPVAPGKFRWAINSQFGEKEFIDLTK